MANKGEGEGERRFVAAVLVGTWADNAVLQEKRQQHHGQEANPRQHRRCGAQSRQLRVGAEAVHHTCTPQAVPGVRFHGFRCAHVGVASRDVADVTVSNRDLAVHLVLLARPLTALALGDATSGLALARAVVDLALGHSGHHLEGVRWVGHRNGAGRIRGWVIQRRVSEELCRAEGRHRLSVGILVQEGQNSEEHQNAHFPRRFAV